MVVCVGVVITPDNGNRIEVRWFKCMQGAQLDGVCIDLIIWVYLVKIIGLYFGIGETEKRD